MGVLMVYMGSKRRIKKKLVPIFCKTILTTTTSRPILSRWWVVAIS